jgi:hypothetical protein
LGKGIMKKIKPYKKFIITRKNEETGKTEYLLWVNDNVYMWCSEEDYEKGCFTIFFEELATETIKKLKEGKMVVWNDTI